MYTSSRNRLTVFLVLIILALTALVLDQTGNLQPLQDLALGILQPVLGSTLGVRGVGEVVSEGLTDPATLRTRMAELQAQVDSMALDNVRLRELETENAILREQLGYKRANTDYELLGAAVVQRLLQPNPDLARVVGVDPSNLVRFIVIDQGSADGVQSGMPVITAQGLVGRVTSTGTHWAKVLLILDPSSSVNSVVQSTRATGVVQGDVNGNLIIKYVPQGEAIKTGDKILTSGLGGNFPKRLVVGQVTEVRKVDNALFQEASIQPSVDFARLEFVLIMKKFIPSDIMSEPTPTPTPLPKPTKTPTPGP